MRKPGLGHLQRLEQMVFVVMLGCVKDVEGVEEEDDQEGGDKLAR